MYNNKIKRIKIERSAEPSSFIFTFYLQDLFTFAVDGWSEIPSGVQKYFDEYPDRFASAKEALLHALKM